MSHPKPLNEQEREELVAFLDGELDEEQSHSVEEKISLNPTLRNEAETLKRTWDLLDYLPKPEASPNFTHNTLDRISPRRTGKAPVLSGKRRWLLVGWGAGALLAFGVGYLLSLVCFPPRPGQRELVRDLRLIENLRYYEPAESLEFLRQLDQPGLFGEDPLEP